jgi:hypothetical protein
MPPLTSAIDSTPDAHTLAHAPGTAFPVNNVAQADLQAKGTPAEIALFFAAATP